MSLVGVRDQFLAARASRGDAAAFAELARRYRRLLWAVSNHPPAGLEPEDLHQEALLGLFAACRRSAQLPGLWFPWLARRHVRWAVAAACTKACRGKHQLLSHAKRDGEEVGQQLENRAAAPAASDPAVVVELRDELRERARPITRRANAPGGDLRRRYSDQQVARAVELIGEGKTLKEAAFAVGAPVCQVERWVKRAGVKRTGGRRRYTEAEKAHALALVDAGLSLAKAGAAVGATGPTVLNGDDRPYDHARAER
jgi:DNA-directed RNA polymerase specialized sigma24 family protein/transposase-like protein